MKKFITAFFVTLGVTFSLILLFIIYLFVFDPFNIKPLIFGGASNTSQNIKADNSDNGGTSTTTTSKPFLSEEQKKTLANFGIDPASLPSTITPTQEACFKTKLGDARFSEISAGASPSITEFLSAKSCL